MTPPSMQETLRCAGVVSAAFEPAIELVKAHRLHLYHGGDVEELLTVIANEIQVEIFAGAIARGDA